MEDMMIVIPLLGLVVLVWILAVEIPNWLTDGHVFSSGDECYDPVEQAAELLGLSSYDFFCRTMKDSGFDFSLQTTERAYVQYMFYHRIPDCVLQSAKMVIAKHVV
jgi:hypothetical protein